MKKILLISLLLVFSLSLTSCWEEKEFTNLEMQEQEEALEDIENVLKELDIIGDEVDNSGAVNPQIDEKNN